MTPFGFLFHGAEKYLREVFEIVAAVLIDRDYWSFHFQW